MYQTYQDIDDNCEYLLYEIFLITITICVVGYYI